MDDACPLCGSTESTPDSDNPKVRYCVGCGAMLNVGGVEGVTMESMFGPYSDTPPFRYGRCADDDA